MRAQCVVAFLLEGNDGIQAVITALQLDQDEQIAIRRLAPPRGKSPRSRPAERGRSRGRGLYENASSHDLALQRPLLQRIHGINASRRTRAVDPAAQREAR
jgi:hypothetical protein